MIRSGFEADAEGVGRLRGATAAAWMLVLIWLLPVTSVGEANPAREDEARRYTYSWQFLPDAAMVPRGGTTAGPDVTLAQGPSEGWQRLSEPGLTRLERDRRAILAMAGGYRTTFDFLETIGFTPDYQPRPPYQSWATEYVYVIADEPAFISLQHILVMTVVQKDGSVTDPMVVKHWRQDWRYEDEDIHVYLGHGRWERERLQPQAVQGAWSQAVFQVDDSPRYQAVGRWEHNGNHSTWVSGPTWRPLPRREFSVRDDYDVLAGTHRVTITRRGWVHEQDNLKVVLEAPGHPHEQTPYLARETGLNRYQLIVDHDFSAGDAYWRRTGPFWREVRQHWRELFERYDALSVRSTVDGERLFAVLFDLAGRFSGESFDVAAAREQIRATLAAYVSEAVPESMDEGR